MGELRRVTTNRSCPGCSFAPGVAVAARGCLPSLVMPPCRNLLSEFAFAQMLKRSLHLVLIALTLVITPSCSSPSADEKKDPNVDAEYKRNHRAEGYREAQNSQPTQTGQ